MRRLFSILSVTAIAVSGVVVSQALAQKRGGVLKIYHRGNPPSGSIHEEATVSTVMPYMSIFNNLVIFDQKKKVNSMETIQPELGLSWSWDATKTRLTFKLRPGVKWHDGKPFTAKDVQCTWDKLKGKSADKLRKNPRRIWYHNLKGVETKGDLEATFVLAKPQPAFLMLLAAGYSPVYPCHVSSKEMRLRPIGTGPFKFVSFKRNESLKFVRNPDYWKKGKPLLDGIDWKVVRSRSTRVLAFAAGTFDMTFANDVTIPLLKDVKAQSPKAICNLGPTGVSVNLIVNRDKPPFDNAKIRQAMAYAINRKAFIDILGQGKWDMSGPMMPPPEGRWGLPKDQLQKLPGYGKDPTKDQAAGRKIMESLGYSADKPLKVKVSTRNIAVYRDPAVILIDQLKKIHISAELDVVDTSIWHAKVARKDYAVGLNLTGVGVDDPDVNFYENYTCTSERNYTKYCNPALEKEIAKMSQEGDYEKRRKMAWAIEKQLILDIARPMIAHTRSATCWHPHVKGVVIQVNSIYNQYRWEDLSLDRK